MCIRDSRLDEVLAEIPRVREDLGFIPLVTPTSQIVGTQAVLNVLGGERWAITSSLLVNDHYRMKYKPHPVRTL